MPAERSAVRAPQQARSRRTLDRILNAAEAMLEDRTFEHAPVAAIVRRARSSVGSFYARFDSKEALLAALLERFDENMLASARTVMEGAERLPPRLEPRVSFYVGTVVNFCATHRGMLRARLVRSVTGGTPPPGRRLEVSSELVRLAHRLFGPCRAEIARPDPDAALDFALQMVDAVASLRIFAPGSAMAGFAPVSIPTLTDELSRAMLGYLTAPGAQARPAGARRAASRGGSTRGGG